MRVFVRRFFTAALCALTLLFCAACRRRTAVVATLSTQPETSVPVAETAPPQETVQTTAAETVTAAPPQKTTAASPAEPETTAAAPTDAPTQASTEAPPETDSITLPIELPEANGEMQVSLDPENLFIREVAASRGVDVSLLAAVYSVPASGQNYVFEFTGAGERTAETLRRVYLLSDAGAIQSVAASNASEREHVSLTENWFCMNVLIKGVIFPSVQEKMQNTGG